MPEMSPAQLSLLQSTPDWPRGFAYQPDFLSAADEERLVSTLASLPFRAFAFRGFTGKRRTLSFGWHYDFNGGWLVQADPMPAFLLPLREQAATLAHLEPNAFEHVLLTEYQPGATIGWHKDRPVFDQVVGVSLLAGCPFRLRRRRGTGWERRSVELGRRSAYRLSGEVRSAWEHSIPPLDTPRYSITFRSMR